MNSNGYDKASQEIGHGLEAVGVDTQHVSSRHEKETNREELDDITPEHKYSLVECNETFQDVFSTPLYRHHPEAK